MANSGRKKYRAILHELDAKGIVIAIIRAGKKELQFHREWSYRKEL